MKIFKTDSELPYYIQVDVTIEEYEKLVEWLRENIPTIDRFTPGWNTQRWDHKQTLKFKFRREEHAMAFKLILSWEMG